MNDALIRNSFHQHVLRRYHDCPHTLVLNELGLKHGEYRADIAVINGSLVGYEIKSDKDSLNRLPKQVDAYDAVFDRAAVVVAPRHACSVTSLLPLHWGIFVCNWGSNSEVEFEIVRDIGNNQNVDPISVAQLLWRNEAVSILRDLRQPQSVLRQKRAALYRHLANNIGLTELRDRVIQRLKNRKNWRCHERPSRYDD